MNALLKTNFLRNQNTVLNSIQLGSIAKNSLPSYLPVAASSSNLKHLKSIDLFQNTTNSFHNITKPSYALSLFKDFASINSKNYFNYSSKVQPETSDNINEDINNQKDNEEKPKQNSNIISMEEFNQMKSELDSQMKKTDELKNKFEQLRKIYLDNISEGDLIKKRHQRELKIIKDYAIGNFAKDLVDVHDNFTRAFDLVKDTKKGEDDMPKEEMFKSFFDGIKMVKSSLSKTFSKHGVIEYTPKVKERFNPSFHEAIYDYEDPSLEVGCIGKVMCSGFMIGNRVLRPAKVGIIKKKII